MPGQRYVTIAAKSAMMSRNSFAKQQPTELELREWSIEVHHLATFGAPKCSFKFAIGKHLRRVQSLLVSGRSFLGASNFVGTWLAEHATACSHGLLVRSSGFGAAAAVGRQIRSCQSPQH
jgi:hypothetical protein